ncbi:aspartate kinase [Maritimibacter dapengensis]|uniref:aspartate kinase n=1 Tax=Maritimibacter dapengensis TaxID=2836868 RepID=A0ABS6T6M7_9RHOB|nr:aspartate kinase [Maritimibacter dapengensis]MBV7380328.1 aspartate kinase [Maritimibacter dapengensis]
MAHGNHTVEKIGGTSMSRVNELRDTLLIAGDDPYNRMFVVSAFGGITNLLLEHKKSGKQGVYALFADSEEDDHSWMAALKRVQDAMIEAHTGILEHPGDVSDATDFVRDRIEGARSFLIDLGRLCSYGHFRLNEHMSMVRELLSGLGEAHSAFVTALMLKRAGVSARFVDLSGWRDEGDCSLDERVKQGLSDIDVSQELPIITGYAQCKEGLMNEYDRGYSEVTFARIAALTHAKEAIIHKEFHLSSADPNLVGEENTRKLGHTNYDVADQLSNLGMEAIHPSAAKMLRQADVPLRVTNAFEPDDPGTLIDDSRGDTPGVEIITALDVISVEVFEQDMVGVKGYDTAILDAMKRHKVWIVSKTSNANTITHYVKGSLKSVRRVERDIAEQFPGAEIEVRTQSIVSAIGRDLRKQSVLGRGLAALDEAGLDVIAAHATPRNVDVQFLMPRDEADKAIAVLHKAFVEKEEKAGFREAA